MFNPWKKKKKLAPTEKSEESPELTWDAKATAALQQAISGAPVPKMVKNKLETELKSAAEAHARAANHTTVTAEDLMSGLMSKLPDSMRGKVDAAIKQGPAGLKNLEQELKGKK